MTLPGFKASANAGSVEFRLQIVVEVGLAADETASHDAANGRTARDASSLPQLLESARALLQDLSQGLDVRMASLTWPSGVRLVAQGTARPEDLAAIRAVAAALRQGPPPGSQPSDRL